MLKNNLTIMYWLWRRDVKAFMKNYKDNLINNVLLIFIISFVFIRLTPLMGISQNIGGDTLIGFAATVVLFTCYMTGLGDIEDLHNAGFLKYKSRLALPFNYFLAQIVFSYATTSLLISLPVLLLSMAFFQDIFIFASIQWFYFFALIFASALLFASLFVLFVFVMPLEMFRDSIWVRILWPLEAFGCLFFSWKAVYDYAPRAGMLFLLNPFTYVVEGLRCSLLPGAGYLRPLPCLGVLLGVTLIILFILFTRVKKSIDGV
jgi:hypothetical protein